ncbi:MAG TPA: pyrroline-5-carboxylate reductase [Phycisphaerae bacterium]|nr:pyrroline-5-carboxylate reductase [Phycisphaerae bacterium]HRY68989.1 pyrroline-5-carboxylate reductase [Phycisphaerae bacterium]HSA26037.1 pyrroline-5-carboxylate reductase [Phycisphaerae bacterium]
MAHQFELGFLGAGNMAEGIVAAVVATKLYPPERLIVADPLPARREFFQRQFGVPATGDNRRVTAECRRIVLAVKPQGFNEAAEAIRDLVRGEQLLISIMAGITTRRIAAAFPGTTPRIVRVMPNLAIKVGAGIAGLCPGEQATERDVAETRAIFDAGGATVVLSDESLMDALTAVSGSGPAYFYAFVEAMAAGGVSCGLNQADALRLAEYACLGAARMMIETGEPPAELRRKVTSKGGTTFAALEHMERAGVPEAIHDAVRAACQRGQELGREG